MNLTISPGDDNLNELARRLFKIRGRRADLDERAAVTALLAANPHLRLDKPIRAGTLIITPDVSGLSPAPAASSSSSAAAESSSPVGRAANDLADQLRNALDRLSTLLAANAKDENQRLDEMLESLKKNTAVLRGADDEVRARIKEVQHAAAARQAELGEHAKQTKQNVARLHKHLDKLANTLAGR